jgi:hypothetical protein
MMTPRAARYLLLVLLELGTFACEVTVEAERGDHETVVMCTLLDHLPDWHASWSALRGLFH